MYSDTIKGVGLYEGGQKFQNRLILLDFSDQKVQIFEWYKQNKLLSSENFSKYIFIFGFFQTQNQYLKRFAGFIFGADSEFSFRLTQTRLFIHFCCKMSFLITPKPQIPSEVKYIYIIFSYFKKILMLNWIS